MLAALSTVERPMMEIQLIDKFGDESAAERRRQMVKEAGSWLEGLERPLEGREWKRWARRVPCASDWRTEAGVT